MQIQLLQTKDIPELPKSLKICQNFGIISITTDDGVVEGNHIVVEGELEDIKTWLYPVDGFWMSIGSPTKQKFELVHIK